MATNTMQVRHLFRTSAFQLALIYAAVFVVSVLVLFGSLYWATVGSINRQINATIESEILGLAEQYERQGLNGLVDVISQRVGRSVDGRAIYLFTDSGLNPIAGNLRKWPDGALIDDGRIEFETTLGDGRSARYRASMLSVGRNYRLLVGRDVRELGQMNLVFERATTWGIAVVLILAFVGGTLMSFSAQRRVATINRTARRIIDGDLSERVPIAGVRDEYYDLATNINEMLAQIEILLSNVRHVGDSIAHDLKTPLTRLRNRLESLASTDTAISPELEKCIDESDRLLATFNALLRIARIESGAYRSEFSRVDLNTVVEDACDLYRVAADEKSIKLSFVPSGDRYVFGDQALLSQVVVNLLDNAIKYTPPGGSIDIVLDRNDIDGDLRLSVSDNGPGVPATDRTRIQQRFVRLDAARSKPGSGLGLSLVKAVADQHRAELNVENLDPGLRISLTFPRNGSAPGGDR